MTSSRTLACTAALLGVCWIPAGPVHAQCSRVSDHEYFASDGADWELFGGDVAISDDWMAAGAANANGGAGAVYVYDRSPIPTEHKIDPVHLGAALFGWSVDLWGDWLVVGDPNWSNKQGRVDLFHYGGAAWTYFTTLTGENDGDEFGYDVSMDDGKLVIGKPGESITGLVELHQYDGVAWQKLVGLQPWSVVPGQRFGTSVFYANDRVAVGFPNPGGIGGFEMFHFSDVVIASDGIFFDPEGGVGELFGANVSTDGNRVIVGKPLDPEDGPNAGSASIFFRNGSKDWSLEQKLTPGPAGSSSQYGTAVWIGDEVALVGAPGYVEDGKMIGNAFQYRQALPGLWLHQAELQGRGVNALYGVSVDAADEAVVGAPYDAGTWSNTGSFYRQPLYGLELNITPNFVPLVAPVEAEVCGGIPNSLLGLFVVGVDGIPVWVAMGFGFHDLNGQWSLMGAHTNPAYSGLFLELMALSVNSSGKVVASNTAFTNLL